MKNRRSVAVISAFFVVVLAACGESEDWTTAEFDEEFPREYMREDALNLNGEWRVLLESDQPGIAGLKEAVENPSWKPIQVPGNLLLGLKREDQLAVRFAWVKREFSLSAEQAARDQVLRWGMIRHGATVWLNGQFIGDHTAIGPAEFFVPRGVLGTGTNRIVLKVPGWSGVAKNAIGKPLIPTGSGPEPWGDKMAQIHDDVWIDFYDGTYLKWILAMPDIESDSVTFRIWADGPQADGDREVQTRIRKWRRSRLEGSASMKASGREPFEVRVPIADTRVWGPETPWLYTAEFAVLSEGRQVDDVTLRFGMRELKIVDGRYHLNGQPTRFFGSNLVNEWNWNLFEGREDMVRYLYDEARAMNLNCFRTHTCPPPARFANVADEVGTMLFAEFPLLYNYKDFKFTPADYQTWHANGILDSTGWVTKLWNHPAIVMWVLTNESRRDVEWESGTLRDHVRSLDPTRPAWRSGGEKGMDEIDDFHICENMSWYAEGRLINRAEKIAEERDPAKPLGCSEYMNFLDPPPVTFRRLLGSEEHPYGMYMQAEHCIEHTEVLRRLRYDLILPYMYAGWTGLRNEKRGNSPWKEEWPTPMAAALYSSFSQVLAGFDLTDRHFVAGADLGVPIVLINDGNVDTTARVDLYLTSVNPLFTSASLPADSVFLHREIGEVEFEADQVMTRIEEIELPQKEGIYYLQLVTRLEGRKPAVSQRMLHLANPATTETGLQKDRRLLILGGDRLMNHWLDSFGADYHSLVEGPIRADGVVICDVAAFKKLPERDQSAVERFVRAGGRLVVLAVDSSNWRSTEKLEGEWLMEEFAELGLGWDNSSRAHPYEGASHPVFQNMVPEGFWRFNGVPNKSSDLYLDPATLPEGTEKILWMENPDLPVLVEIPVGKGRMLVSMLYLKSRLDRSQPQYDPFAERIMANLLFGEEPARMAVAYVSKGEE